VHLHPVQQLVFGDEEAADELLDVPAQCYKNALGEACTMLQKSARCYKNSLMKACSI